MLWVLARETLPAGHASGLVGVESAESFRSALNFLCGLYASSIRSDVLMSGGACRALFSTGMSSMLSCRSEDDSQSETSFTLSSSEERGLLQMDVLRLCEPPLPSSLPLSMPESVGDSSLRSLKGHLTTTLGLSATEPSSPELVPPSPPSPQ